MQTVAPYSLGAHCLGSTRVRMVGWHYHRYPTEKYYRKTGDKLNIVYASEAPVATALLVLPLMFLVCTSLRSYHILGDSHCIHCHRRGDHLLDQLSEKHNMGYTVIPRIVLITIVLGVAPHNVVSVLRHMEGNIKQLLIIAGPPAHNYIMWPFGRHVRVYQMEERTHTQDYMYFLFGFLKKKFAALIPTLATRVSALFVLTDVPFSC